MGKIKIVGIILSAVPPAAKAVVNFIVCITIRKQKQRNFLLYVISAK